MSEYTPITGELRKYEALLHDEGSAALARIGEFCDAIDAVHAQLERENESLKAELDRVLSEQEHAVMSAMNDALYHANDESMAELGWVRLPKDADRVPIRVGDTVEYVDDTLAPRNVTSINLAGDGWWVYTNGFGRRPDKCRHVTPDTWESILADAMAYAELPTDMDMQLLVARCKALCERTKEDA